MVISAPMSETYSKGWLKAEKEADLTLILPGNIPMFFRLIYRLCEELRNRKASITEFFLSYVYSNTDNIQANLHYLDYLRLIKKHDKKDDGPKDS
jgi:hypothetical protein